MKESRHNLQSDQRGQSSPSKKRIGPRLKANDPSQSDNPVASFLNHLPGFAWMKDLKGRYVYVNSALKNVEEYREGCIGLTDADLWP